jgi:hypothetical protein
MASSRKLVAFAATYWESIIPFAVTYAAGTDVGAQGRLALDFIWI